MSLPVKPVGRTQQSWKFVGLRTTTWGVLAHTQDNMAHLEEATGVHSVEDIMRAGQWTQTDHLNYYININNKRSMTDLHHGDKVLITKEGSLKGCNGWFLNIRVGTDGHGKGPRGDSTQSQNGHPHHHAGIQQICQGCSSCWK
jgi:hypothetical protein